MGSISASLGTLRFSSIPASGRRETPRFDPVHPAAKVRLPRAPGDIERTARLKLKKFTSVERKPSHRCAECAAGHGDARHEAQQAAHV